MHFLKIYSIQIVWIIFLALHMQCIFCQGLGCGEVEKSYPLAIDCTGKVTSWFLPKWTPKRPRWQREVTPSIPCVLTRERRSVKLRASSLPSSLALLGERIPTRQQETWAATGSFWFALDLQGEKGPHLFTRGHGAGRESREERKALLECRHSDLLQIFTFVFLHFFTF